MPDSGSNPGFLTDPALLQLLYSLGGQFTPGAFGKAIPYSPTAEYGTPQGAGLPNLAQVAGDRIQAERAKSAAMGLWDDKTGLPTKAGMMDAARAVAGNFEGGIKPTSSLGGLKNALSDPNLMANAQARFDEFHNSPEYKAYREDLNRKRELHTSVYAERNYLIFLQDRLKEPDVGPTERARIIRSMVRTRANLQKKYDAAEAAGVDPEGKFPADEMSYNWMRRTEDAHPSTFIPKGWKPADQ